MLKAVVFDMDGVLIDSEYTYFAAKIAILHDARIEKDESYLYQFMGTTREYMWQTMKDQLNLPGRIEDYIADMDRRRAEMVAHDGIVPIKGAAELVRKLHQLKIPLAVASSTEKTGIEFALDSLKIKDCFQYLVSGEEVAHSKPEPDVYLKAIEKLGFRPQECLAVEDTVNGSLSAKRAGMYVAGYINPSYAPQSLSADETFADYSEFLDKFLPLFKK